MRQKLAVLENGMDALRKSSSISRKPTMNFLPTASRDKAQAQHKHSNQYDDTVSRSTTSTRSMMLHYDDAEVYSAEKGENGEHEAVANDARHETIQQEPTGHDDSGVVIAIDDDFEDELPSTGLTSGDGATMVSKRAKLSLSSALNANVEAANSSPSALHSSVRPAVSAQPHIEFSEMSTLHSAKDSHRSEFVITKSSSGRSASRVSNLHLAKSAPRKPSDVNTDHVSVRYQERMILLSFSCIVLSQVPSFKNNTNYLSFWSSHCCVRCLL
eukprot:m.140282 g.140282  ORF g.140282 m.140282 type:complete len:271 (-) comp15960_c0_seq3:594-1406(-)